jgi:hypothetical protein
MDKEERILKNKKIKKNKIYIYIYINEKKKPM